LDGLNQAKLILKLELSVVKRFNSYLAEHVLVQFTNVCDLP
jgi:hypothetical protein